jgi:hypothetical protein
MVATNRRYKKHAHKTAVGSLHDFELNRLWVTLAGDSLPIQPHGGITLTCCNFISSIK